MWLKKWLIVVLCTFACACSQAPVPGASSDVEGAYKASSVPPPGFARVYIFPISHFTLGHEIKKTADIYIGDQQTFCGQVRDGEFVAFDIKPGTTLVTVRMWNNLKIINQPLTFVEGSTMFIKPDFDKRPETGASFSPLMLFGAVGGAIAGATAEKKTLDPGSFTSVDATTAMAEIQPLHIAGITSQARDLIRQEVPR